MTYGTYIQSSYIPFWCTVKKEMTEIEKKKETKQRDNEVSDGQKNWRLEARMRSNSMKELACIPTKRANAC